MYSCFLTRYRFLNDRVQLAHERVQGKKRVKVIIHGRPDRFLPYIL